MTVRHTFVRTLLVLALTTIVGCTPAETPATTTTAPAEPTVPAATSAPTPTLGPEEVPTTAPTDIGSVGPDFPNAELLVETEWLADHRDDPDLVIVDMREPAAFVEGHIPGAVNMPVEGITSRIDFPFQLDRDEVAAGLARIGLDRDDTAVLYDDLGMMSAARMFWTLEYVGHADARVLHGGWNAWVEQGRETSTTTAEPVASDYPLELDPSKLATADEVLDALDDPDVVIVDARSPAEYTGEVALSDRGGHIPGAVNLPWSAVLTGGDTLFVPEGDWQAELRDPDVEVFRSPAEIRTLLDEHGITPDKTAITYCQTLWRGAHAYFLLRLMGHEDVRGYDGSWAEWGNRDDLPVVTGPEPGDA